MMNTINQLVNQINQTKEVLEVMDSKILQIEMSKLNGIIEVAKQGLLFQPIYENAFGQESDYFDEEEYFKNDTGEVLKGILVYFSNEFYGETEDGDREINTEIFLVEDGSLKVFHTFIELYQCEECELTHGHSHRIVCENQALDGFDIGVIINNITVDLKMRASYLEERKKEQMAKLESLKKAQ